MSTASSTITIIMGIKRSHRRTKPGTGRRLLVRDAGLRPAPHHEAEQAPARSPLIPRSRAKRGVSKDEAIDAGNLNASALYRLMAWLSPAYPIGAFSYSSGMEWAVEAGDITDAASLERWLAVMIADGSGFCDAVFFAHAHRTVVASDDDALRAVAELAAAFAPSKERHLETTAQGRAFLDSTRAAWPTPALDRLLAIWDGAIALPVAVAVACAGACATATTAATQSKCKRPIPTASRWSSRSTPTIRRWRTSSPTGRRRRARSASASS